MKHRPLFQPFFMAIGALLGVCAYWAWHSIPEYPSAATNHESDRACIVDGRAALCAPEGTIEVSRRNYNLHIEPAKPRYCDKTDRESLRAAIISCTSKGGTAVTSQWRESCFEFTCSADAGVER